MMLDRMDYSKDEGRKEIMNKSITITGKELFELLQALEEVNKLGCDFDKAEVTLHVQVEGGDE